MPRKKKAKQITRVALVVDRSGSMMSCSEEAFNMINMQIETIKQNAKKGGDTFFTYVQFDNIIETVYKNRPAKELVPLKREEYQPRGGTALLDATFAAINDLTGAVEDTEDTAYLILVLTDGEENSSKDIDGKSLASLIKSKEESGRWTITYLMANVDTEKFARSMNLSVNNVASYISTPIGTATAGFAMSASMNNYFAARSAGVTQTKTFYSPTTTDTVEATTPPAVIKTDA